MAHHPAPQGNDSNYSDHEVDGCSDALAATAIIAIIVTAVSFWLSGMA